MQLLPENIVNLRGITIDPVRLPELVNAGIILDVLRLDKIDPVISGNKWFKLQYYLQWAIEQQRSLLTFGGAYSNHIVATACAAQKAGLKSTGIIRGERPSKLSHTLLKAAGFGMELVFLSRAQYHQKNDPGFIEQLNTTWQYPCIIPEGGAGEKGIKGAASIMNLPGTADYTHLVCAIGTGTLLCGLASAAAPSQLVTGIAVLKGFNEWQPSGIPEAAKNKINVVSNYHFGGYARKTTALINFMNDWYMKTGIPTDFVYTGKLFYAVMDLIAQGNFADKSRLLVIHSGGLQGNKSLTPKTLFF